jgi:hypothetical protein
MRHYDECYSADERELLKKHSRKLVKDLQVFIENGSIEDKEFIVDIINNIKDYKGFFNVLHQKK